MEQRRTLRIFISSPSDVRPERFIAERVIQRLAREFAYHFVVEPVLWEREPLIAGEHFQARIVPPHETDIVVVIVWSRLGVPLPADKYVGALSGRSVTGTEWEFEDALASYREKKLPDLLLYRKKAEVVGSLEDETQLQEQLAQKRLLEEFMVRWTRAADQKSFTAASWEFDNAAAFEEMLEDHLRELIRRRITAPDEGPTGIRWHHGSPFRGLESFDLEHATVFFGRTHARNELRELLARQANRGSPFVLVMGASGSGKSSLVKAGLLPDLQLPGMIDRVALCRFCILRPSDGTDMVATLAAALLQTTALPELKSLEYDVENLAGLLRAGSTQAGLPIRQGLATASKAASLSEHADARLLVIVDQLEEIFTGESITDADRDAFIAAIEALVKTELVWVVATMRSDFFDRLVSLPRLLNLSAGEARYLLAPPVSAEIAQMIRQPAREAGLRFEVDEAAGVGLDEVILQSAVRDPQALPLLSFLLDQLWQRRSANGILTFAAYEKLGGLEGSLGQRADEVFAALPLEVQQALPEVLRALVTIAPGSVGGARQATARPAPLSRFPKGTQACALIDALLDPKARLLVAYSDERRGAQVRVAHEALLSHWSAARKQIESDARDLELRSRLEQAAQLWQQAPKKHRKSLLLPRGLPLDEARDLLRRWRSGIEATIVQFVESSAKAARLRTLRFAAYIVAGMLSVPAAIGIGWVVMVWRGVQSVERNLAMVRVPAGCFLMGSPPDELGRDKDESPQHKVCVKTFYLGKYELTQSQWQAVMLENPSQYVGPNRPVENISWDDIQVFLGRMNRFGSRVYRMPSEAEWEYAARAGSQTAYPWGPTLLPDACKYANINDLTFKKSAPRDPISPQAANCNDGFYRTAPVGGRQPNKFGLYDMEGNVWEWVADQYRPDYKGAPDDGSVWPGKRPHGYHVLRGGSWHTVGRRVRSAQREKELADYRIGYTGFRIAASAGR